VPRIGSKSKGFTLLELLVTVALIGVLATIAVTQFAAYRQKGFNSAALSDLGNAKIVFEAYFAENHFYPQ
jgi:type IV pilus assembly protein PilA